MNELFSNSCDIHGLAFYMTDNFYLQMFLTFVASLIGFYSAAFFKKYGENQAMNKNFTAIREQLKTTTDDTEKIKQQLSGSAWRSQQQWTALEKCYSQLLTSLHHFKLALDGLSLYYIEPGSDQKPDQEQPQSFHTLRTQAYSSYHEVEKLMGASAMFLSDAAVNSLDKLFEEHCDLEIFQASCTAEYVEKAQVLVKSAYDTIRHEARAQLDIKVNV